MQSNNDKINKAAKEYATRYTLTGPNIVNMDWENAFKAGAEFGLSLNKAGPIQAKVILERDKEIEKLKKEKLKKCKCKDIL